MTTAPLEPAILVAANLRRAGFLHGFSTRNTRAVASAVGFEESALRQVTQVHGARVVDGSALMDAGAREEADALVLRARHDSAALAIAVRTADCVPILIGSRARGVAAIHAGWRGVVAGVIGAALEALGGDGPDDAVAAIGPCIGACCFEVGADVASRIATACDEPRVIARTADDKAYVDLRLAVRAQLAKHRVVDVEDVPGCTRCDAARFFSYRRDGEHSGRHLAAIVARD